MKISSFTGSFLAVLCFYAGSASLAAADSYPQTEAITAPWPPTKLSKAQTAIWDEGVKLLLTSCVAANSMQAGCSLNAKRFVEEYVNAYAGDYLAQSNTATAFSNASYLQKNDIAACAWRNVMAGVGSPYYNNLDNQTFSQYCGSLDDAGRASATARGEQIVHILNSHSVKRIAVPEIGFDPAKEADEGN